MAQETQESSSTNNCQLFNDRFDIIDDVYDGLQFSKDTLDEYMLPGRLQTMTYEEDVLNAIHPIQVKRY